MTSLIPFGRAASRSILFAGLLASTACIASAAFAGECPADKMKADVRQPVGFCGFLVCGSCGSCGCHLANAAF